MNRIQLFLTKMYLRTIDVKYSGTSKVSLPDSPDLEVVTFSSENDFRLGQATVTKTIIIHDKCFRNKTLLLYVVAHEYGHNRSWYGLLVVPVILALWLYGLFVMIWSLLSLHISSFIVGLSATLIGCILSWILEYKAESIAIKILGVKWVISARRLMSNMPKPPLVWRIISRATHPPFSWTLSIYRFFHKDRI